MKIGDAVIFVSPIAEEFNAVVTQVWGEGDTPSVNLCYVSGDLAKNDQYGRQIERSTSVVNEVNQYAHGNYWKALA